MTSTGMAWGKALAERYCSVDSVLHFHVNAKGEMYYGVLLYF